MSAALTRPPDFSSPDFNSPDFKSGDFKSADIKSADFTRPDVIPPDVTPPNVIPPDVAPPNVTLPDITTLAAAPPDTLLADTALLDIAPPGIALPETALPQTAALAAAALVSAAVAAVGLPPPDGRAVPIRRTCLVVDDSRVVRCVAASILQSAGFAVQEAENGLAALHACRARMPDCVLLDGAMPVMGGLAFLLALRAEFGPQRPPVVFCATENELSFIERAIAGGAQEYIMKPFDEEILLSKLRLVGLT